MNEDRLNELLKQLDDSPIERELLQNLYPHLTTDRAQELRPQYKIGFIPGLPVTTPDFAFPDMKIAIYCDGYKFHKDEWSFSMDRFQSNELQSRGWIVFRFSGYQIHEFAGGTVEAITRAIAQRDKRQQAELEKHQQLERHQQKSIELEEKLRKEQQAKLEKHQQLERHQQKSIELEEKLRKEQQAKLEKHQQLERHQQKSKVELYVVAVLGVCLLISTVFLWVQSSKPELPPVYRIDEVVVIPAGEFQMGGSDSDAEIDEHPVHTVDVNAFYIHKYEVTNAQYKNFVDANLQWQKNSIPRKFHNGEYLKLWKDNTYPSGKENHPVVFVSWYAAMAYAKWAGRRLPTEAEWEKVARGGLVGAKYPWGDVIDDSMANYGGDFGDTKPVGSYSPNDYGLYDMTGNVMEWCLDAYDENFYNHSPSRNPIAGGTLVDIVNNFVSVTNPRVVRSGCWYNVPMHVRVADRYGTSPDDASGGRGFRCAGSVTGLSE